jgi:hypothetical protein
VEFVQGAGNNIFYGATMSKVGGEKWANPQYNPVQTVDDEFEDDPDLDPENAPSLAISRGLGEAERVPGEEGGGNGQNEGKQQPIMEARSPEKLEQIKKFLR